MNFWDGKIKRLFRKCKTFFGNLSKLLNITATMEFKSFINLVRKDILLELRQKHAFFGMLLYVGSTVFVIYMMSGQPEARIWNSLFWITQLFVAVNSVARSFLQESADRFRYYFTIVSPVTFLAAKMVYSMLLMLVISLLSLLLFLVMLGTPLLDTGLFVLVTFIGSISLSAVFTFLSAIAAKAHQNAALMAILGFPLVTPVLMILSKLAVVALDPVAVTGWWRLAGALLFVDALVIILGIILFPFLWQE